MSTKVLAGVCGLGNKGTGNSLESIFFTVKSSSYLILILNNELPVPYIAECVAPMLL